MNLPAYLATHYTAATAQSYHREILIFLGNYRAARTAAYSDLIAYIGILRERYDNAQTLHRIVCSIKVYYDYLCASGQRMDHPARAIYLRDQRSRDVQLQDLFSAEELERLLDRTERYKALYYRNRVLMELLVYQGVRVQELAALYVTDMNLEAATVYVKPTATTNARTLSLKPHQVVLLYSYIDHVRPGLLKQGSCPVLLVGLRGHPMQAADIISHVHRSYRHRYPGRAVTAQTIRQSVIANLLQRGHDISIVQRFAGHKYPSSTEKYKQSQVETLRVAIGQYHPMR